jgi:hypothetical protein
MSEWHVLVEARAPEGETLAEDDPAIAGFFDLLAPCGGAVSAGGLYWAARVSIEAAGVDEVFPTAISVVRDAAGKAGLPNWPVVRAELADPFEFQMELERPAFPWVLGHQEVVKRLGITRQRLSQLRASGRFPQPVVELAAGPLWLASTIDAFLEGWDRRPGRPSRNCPMCGHQRSEVRTLVPNGVRVDQVCTTADCELKDQRVGLEREEVK